MVTTRLFVLLSVFNVPPLHAELWFDSCNVNMGIRLRRRQPEFITPSECRSTSPRYQEEICRKQDEGSSGHMDVIRCGGERLARYCRCHRARYRWHAE